MENSKPTREELKEKLTPEEYDVIVNKGTEQAFTGKYYKHTDKGMYTCKACGIELFDSNTKFNSHSGWPSFDQSIEGRITYHEDTSHGMRRTEVTCANCSAHLGHVFPDGPKDTTGKRYCINSCSLDFEKDSSNNS